MHPLPGTGDQQIMGNWGRIRWVFPRPSRSSDPIVAEERCPRGHLIAAYRRSEWAGSGAESRASAAAAGHDRLYDCCEEPKESADA
jgi:hypothetical protein